MDRLGRMDGDEQQSQRRLRRADVNRDCPAAHRRTAPHGDEEDQSSITVRCDDPH